MITTEQRKQARVNLIFPPDYRVRLRNIAIDFNVAIFCEGPCSIVTLGVIDRLSDGEEWVIIHGDPTAPTFDIIDVVHGLIRRVKRSTGILYQFIPGVFEE